MYIPLTFEGALQKCLFASGGLEGFFISGSQQWKYHMFTGAADLVVQKGTIDNVQIYVIGGGGGGARGTANTNVAGGGGGGGTNFTMNARLFQGTYNIVVGEGGDGASIINSDGFSGSQSSIIGADLNLVAKGGGGGTWGASGRGGVSGNGFAGGTSQLSNGGGGGGSTAVGDNATALKAGNGGAGNTFYIAEYAFGYGCGGGGYARSTSTEQGFSCSGTIYGEGGEGNNDSSAGANRFGMGGGGNGNSGSAGGSGSVIIQYPIYDYCSNYFDETGSCGCREVTFDISDPVNYLPDLFGNYLYTPCGTNELVSGSILAYQPVTVCAASSSFYWVNSNSSYGNSSGTLVESGPQCISASYGVETCVTQSFPPTCSGSFVFYKGGTSSTFYYIPTNSSSLSYSPIANNNVSFKCVSSGSFSGIGSYPYGLSGAGAAISTSSITFCTSYLFTPGSGTQTATYYECSTDTLVSIAISTPTRFCTRNGRPRTLSGGGSTIVAGGGCVTGGSGSCGCP